MKEYCEYEWLLMDMKMNINEYWDFYAAMWKLVKFCWVFKKIEQFWAFEEFRKFGMISYILQVFLNYFTNSF